MGIVLTGIQFILRYNIELVTSRPTPPCCLPLIHSGLIVTYWMVVQAVPSPSQRLFSDGLRQDCSSSMALVVRRGEITRAARPDSGHWVWIWGRIKSVRKPGLLRGQEWERAWGPWLPTLPQACSFLPSLVSLAPAPAHLVC